MQVELIAEPGARIGGGLRYTSDLLGYREIRGAVLKSLQETAKYTVKYLEGITETWEHEVTWHPSKGGKIAPQIRYSGGNVSITVYTEDDIFRFLDEGTLIRWAVMSNPYVPKTSASFKSVAGSGYPIIRGKSNMQKYKIPPMPGIQARNWMRNLKPLIDTSLGRSMNLAILKAVTGLRRTGRI